MAIDLSTGSTSDSLYHHRHCDQLVVWSEDRAAAGGTVTSYLAVVSGYKGMTVHEPGCNPRDPEYASNKIYKSRKSHPHRFLYSFMEVRPALICLDYHGNELDAKDCVAAELETGSPMDKSIRHQAIPESEGGRIGVLDYPEIDNDPNHIWAFNLTELLHQWPPPRNDDTCEVDESTPYVIYDIDIHNSHYGAQFNAVPPGGLDADSTLDYQFIVEITEVDDFVLGQKVRYFDHPGQHEGDCN